MDEKNNKIVIKAFKTQLDTSVGFINRQQQNFTFPQFLLSFYNFFSCVCFIYTIFFYQRFRSTPAPGTAGHRKLSGVGLLNTVTYSY